MEQPTFYTKSKPPPPQKPPPPPAPPSNYPSSYDDVFFTAQKHKHSNANSSSTTLAPRPEDYSEIFSGFRTSTSSSRASSSIPVLDLPSVDANANTGDLGFGFDYNDVFGQVRGVEFALPFDDLFRGPDRFRASDDDDDDAWTPLGTESHSDDSDPFAFTEKSRCVMNGNINQPSEDKQFNVSYHKVNPGTSTCVPDTVHVTQLHDVPVYTCVVEEAGSLGEICKESNCTPAVEDIVLNLEAPSIITHKHARKTSSHHSNEGVESKFSGPKASESCDLEAKIDGRLPSFFDMEVDANSSAAASAAAMKDVMEKAQAKLNAARESRGRKDAVQNNVNLSSDNDANGRVNVEMAHESVSEEKKLPAKSYSKVKHERNISQNVGVVGMETDANCSDEITHTECPSQDKKLHATSDSGASKMKTQSKARHGRSISKILPETLADVQAIGLDEKTGRTKSSSSMDITGMDGEWKEASQYFEFVSNDNSRSAYQPPSRGDQKNEMSKQEDDNDTDSDSAGESFVTQTNRPKLKAYKVVSRQGFYEKMIKVAQDVHDTVSSGHAETKEGLQDIFHGDSKNQKPKLIVDPTKNGGRVLDTHRAEAKYAEVLVKAEAEMKPKIVARDGTLETGETEGTYKGLNCISRNDPLVNMTKEFAYSGEEERIVKGTCEREASGGGAHEGIVELSTEALTRRKNEESEGMKGKNSKVVFGEKDRTIDIHQMKAECWKSTEVVDGAAKERLERSCEGHENNRTTALQQTHKREEHVENTSNGRGPEMTIDQNVELEKCWEYLETMEQEKSRLNLDKGHNFVDDNNSVENHKKEEKPEQTAEKGNVESNSRPSGELGESFILNAKSDFMEDQNGVVGSHVETDGEDEGPEPDSSLYTELPLNDKHQKLPHTVNFDGKDVKHDAGQGMLKRPHIKANGFLEVSSGKENGEIGTKILDQDKLEGFETADMLFDSGELRKAPPRVGLSDKKLEGKADPAPPTVLQMKANGSVLSQETSSKAGETNDVIAKRLKVFPEAQGCPSDDEDGRKTVKASRTLQTNDKNIKSGEIFDRQDQIKINENRKVQNSISDPTSVKPSHVDEQGGAIRNQGGEEQNIRPAQFERVNGLNEHPIKGVGSHSVIPERKQSIPRTTFQGSSLGQNFERNGKMVDDNGSLEEKEEDSKGYLEKEHNRKLEEEREREKEREKDKMAVEVAIREARERAYVDARDRAERAAIERATEEVRQRAMTEARERLEKACAEARERSLSNKASEGRLRAERAAVDRATAEARQRAIEKSMADIETRERVQRSMSEKFTSDRDVIMRQSSFPSTSERFETNNGEPVERCKARLERHRRTVERVANALAEKNMRDLLAQREQAERNRFAETLDADIKRWSSGKTGNLRALLSTLQYILGPDSGWQPIPLTEVITAAAVKRAYRKATLCVHPDKLQQRGASIQQKYISEKVFDLLKEAWNRFNSEEK